MKHEPHDFEAPTRRAELKEWLATLRGPGKPDYAAQLREEYNRTRNAAGLHGGWGEQRAMSPQNRGESFGLMPNYVPSHEDWLPDPMKRHT